MADKLKTVICQLLFGASEAAAVLGISERLLWQFVAAGEIKVRKVASRTLIHKRELERFAARDHTSPLKKVKIEDGAN